MSGRSRLWCDRSLYRRDQRANIAQCRGWLERRVPTACSATMTVGGSLEFNAAYGCSSPLTGGTDATTMQIGNDTGSGMISMLSLQKSTPYANDVAAAAGGVQIGQLYRTQPPAPL